MLKISKVQDYKVSILGLSYERLILGLKHQHFSMLTFATSGSRTRKFQFLEFRKIISVF